jgi:hypothetical protein
MIIRGIFSKATQEILYSRSQHDCNMSEDKLVGIDGGLWDYCRILGTPEHYIMLDLDGDVLLTQILEYDWAYKNSRAESFPNGYCGRYKITPYSNAEFFKKLVLNFNEIKGAFI